MALGTPVAGAAAYSAQGGTTVAPAYPAGILATDAVLLFVGQKPSTANGGTVTTPTGWTLRDELTGAGGYGTTVGIDTGNTNLRVYSWNTPVAGQTGNLTVTIGTNNISWAFIVRIPSGGGALSYGSADGQRTTQPTSPMSIALTNGATATNFQSGDRAIWAMCIPTDVTTPSQFSAQSITATGATFGTATELNEPDSGTGNDIGGYSAWAAVTAGSSTTAPTVTTTVGGTLTNVRGPVVLLRVREGAAPQTLTPTLYTNTQTFHNPTVTPGAVALTPSLYTNDQTFYSPDVTTGGATQALTASLYTNTQTFYGPTITRSNTLAPSLYTNTQTFFAPTVSTSVTITPSLYSNAQTFYSPTASASNTLTPGLYTNTQTFYGAVVSQTGGTQTLLPDLYTNAQTFYTPTVGRGAVNLSPSLYSNSQTFYAPTVAPGTVTLAPSLYTNAQTFYAATVSQASTTQNLTFEDYVEVDYVEPGYVTWVAGFQAGNQFFSLSLQQFEQVGENWMPQIKRRRRWSEERDEREQLRKDILNAIEPVAEKEAKVVNVKGKVAVVTKSQAIPIPVPPQFDAQAVVRMVMSVLEKQGIEAQRVREIEARKQARIAFERERQRRLIKRRREEEIMLLMG